jgi:hypothetical protein
MACTALLSKFADLPNTSCTLLVGADGTCDSIEAAAAALTNYKYTQGKDLAGRALVRLLGHGGDWAMLAERCDTTPMCVGFDTWGVLYVGVAASTQGDLVDITVSDVLAISHRMQ